MVRVSCLIPCRDGEQNIRDTIESLQAQTVTPFIVVTDDASTDSTPEILEKLGVPFVTYPHREPRSYARVPTLLNLAMRLTPKSDYYMISGDDCTYPPHYIEVLTNLMEAKHVDCASGYINKFNQTATPHGAGRILTHKLFAKVTPFVQNIGWESYMIYKARKMGLSATIFPIKFNHDREYTRHSTWTFGHSSYMLGNPLIFTLGRVVKVIIRREHKPLNAFAILLGHLEYIIRHPRRLDIAPFVDDFQRRRIANLIARKLSLRAYTRARKWVTEKWLESH